MQERFYESGSCVPKNCASLGVHPSDLGPSRAGVGGFVEAAAGTKGGSLLPWLTDALPKCGVDHAGIAGFEAQVHGASNAVFVQNFLPGFAAIGGTEDSAIFIGAEAMPQSGDEHDVWIARIDQNTGDVAGVFEADVLPGFSAVGGFVHSVAVGDVGVNAIHAAADVNNVGV